MKGRILARTLALAFSAKVCFLHVWAQDSGRGEALQFNRDVRPILADHCYACHGPDAHSRKAKLRLDKRESALGTNREGAAIVPGKPDLSELVFRIHNKDPDEVMPPPELNKPLSPAEKKILVRWIAEGAKYEKHWAFEPPRREDLPTVKKTDWTRNPIGSLHPCPAGTRKHLTIGSGQSGNPDSPSDVRLDRFALHAGGGRCFMPWMRR